MLQNSYRRWVLCLPWRVALISTLTLIDAVNNKYDDHPTSMLLLFKSTPSSTRSQLVMQAMGGEWCGWRRPSSLYGSVEGEGAGRRRLLRPSRGGEMSMMHAGLEKRRGERVKGNGRRKEQPDRRPGQHSYLAGDVAMTIECHRAQTLMAKIE